MGGQDNVYIVSERMGPGTGDRYYVDHRGRVWKPHYSSECGTGEVSGTKTGDRIYPRQF